MRNMILFACLETKVHRGRTLTRTVASLAAMIKMSAQETTPGQTFSTAFLALSITSYDLSEFILDKESFSPSMFGVSSSSSEASHPYKAFEKHKRKMRRMTEAALLGSLAMLFLITFLTRSSACGQVLE